MREDEQIDCPQCFSWRGYADQYPCPSCGYDPKLGPMLPVVDKPATEAPPPAVDQSQVVTIAQPAPVPAPPSSRVVQCTTCYSEVAPGERCSACNNVLEAR